MTMAQIIEILKKIVDNPKTAPNKVLTEEDFACLRRVAGGASAPPKKGKK
jgi:hypothetical protein